MMGETRPGALAEYCVARASQLIRLPDAVSFEDASCLPVAYGTAHRMLFTRGKVAAGEKVLILGASGGVGTACVMLCKSVGAHVVACASTDAKCERLKELGADETLNYAEIDFVRHTREATGTLFRGGGYDAVVNYSGGDYWAKSLALREARRPAAHLRRDQPASIRRPTSATSGRASSTSRAPTAGPPRTSRR